MDSFKDDLRAMLRQVRLACGYTQDAVAVALNISRSTYTYYENGRTSPDVATLKRLAAIFAIPVEAFLYPERFRDFENNRQRAPKLRHLNPKKIGDLTAEEQVLVAQHRLEQKGLAPS